MVTNLWRCSRARAGALTTRSGPVAGHAKPLVGVSPAPIPGKQVPTLLLVGPPGDCVLEPPEGAAALYGYQQPVGAPGSLTPAMKSSMSR